VRIAAVTCLALLLGSCLGVEFETKFNEDGSGTMYMKVIMSKAVMEMGQESGGDTDMDIPMSTEDIEAQYEGAEGVTLIEATQEETEQDLIMTATVEFESLEALVEAEAGDSPVETASLQREGSNTVFTMVVGEAREALEGEDTALAEEGMDEAMIAMIEAFLEGYFMEYRVTAPKKVIRHSHGELSENSKSVLLRIPMAEYFTLENPYTFEVVW